MKTRIILLRLVLPALLAACYFFWPGKRVTVLIPEGSAAGQVARVLKEKNIIISSTWFKMMVKLTGTGKKIMPGEYTFRQYMSAEETLWRILHNTYVNNVRVVIPEGWRMEQIAERLAANGVTDKKQFENLARKEALEGYLFPSTYFFKKNTSAREVINLLKSEFDRQVRPLFAKGFPAGLNEGRVLVLASIVEREAAISSERPLVAAVYLNRYYKRMPLEADPTVQYAIGYYEKDHAYWKKRLTYKDLEFKSAYNTYQVGGLPPGPICNPGADSVSAVFNPANIDALYFVADRKGKHIFNLSFSEHKKARWRVEQAAKEDKE
jgi:UPF0755 protein